MDITPQISANGEITLHVHPIITRVTEQPKDIGGRSAPLAKTSIREMDSIIKAENGKIVVLGGLAWERNVDEAAGLPGANRVPILGAALEQRQRSTVKSEFIILLKPIIANSTSDRELMRESNERFRNLNRSLDPYAN
jgi:MSHA biogenesis protein MshL